MGDGRAQEGVDAGKDRGAAEGRMARRPAHADKPRMPPPVDPRETAEGVGPQAVPASRQAAPHAFEGQEGEGVFCQIFVGRFGVSFSPFERLFLGRFGFGQSCGLSVIA